MRGAYCYLPILPARRGAFRAVGALSPSARSRLTPMFDVRTALLENGKTIESYLRERAKGIHECWEPERPVYIDVHDLPLERTSTGAYPIAVIVDSLRSLGSRVIPVTGTEADRDKEYLSTIRALVPSGGDGACLRLARDELNEPKLLRSSALAVLDLIKLPPESVDVVLDFRHVGRDTIESLRATTPEALQAVQSIGSFRNVAVAGSSVPDLLTKRTQGVILKVPRKELELWTEVLPAFASSWPIPLSDYAIVGAHYVPPAKVVRSPARVRYTTLREHIFRRAKRGEYRGICKQLVDSDEYLGATYSLGDQRIQHSAMQRGGPGNPAIWVAYDTNHHLELVSEQAWNFVKQRSLENRFELPEPNPRPWLQPELIDA